MRNFWTRINYLLRHQVSLRVLPVVLLSVIVLGAFSMMVFERHALGHAAGFQQHELEDLEADLHDDLVRMAIMAELRKTQVEAIGLRRDCTVVQNDLLGMACVSGVALIDRHDPGALDARFMPALANEENLRRAAEWYQGITSNGGSPGPDDGVLLAADALHTVHVLPPLRLHTPAQSDGRAAGDSPHFALLIRHRRSVTDQSTLLFVNVQQVLDNADLPDWFCLLDGQGRLQYRRDLHRTDFWGDWDGAQIQKKLAGGDLHNRGELFRGKLIQGKLFRGELFGRFSEPWLVTELSSAIFPGCTFLTARPADDLRALLGRYLAFVCGIGLLALFGAMLGVMRVMGPCSRRLQELSENMSALAQGEYSRRMPEGHWDEIGQLVGYFNMMAVSLDEAHREVRKKSLEQRAALENMRLLDQAKDDFLVLISHEVRTPLTAIMGGVDFLKGHLDRASEDEREVLDRLDVTEVISIIHNSGVRLSGFMTDAIQMTSIQSTDRKLHLKATPVVELVEMGLVGIRDRAMQRSILVDNQLEGRAWSLLGDTNVLKMALEKILDNALVHNRDGGKIIIREAWEVPAEGTAGALAKPSCWRTLQEQPSFSDWEGDDLRWRLIEVYNSGRPIPAERRKALFGKFELVGRIEHHHKGSGLSLPIAKRAVGAHGGRILMHSDGRDGNSFYLLLPTVLDKPRVEAARPTSLWDEAGQSVVGAAWHEEVGQVTDLATLKVKVDDPGTTPPSGVDQTGGGVDGPGSANDQEEVTVGSGGE